MAIHLIDSNETIKALDPHARRLKDGNGLYIRQAPTGRKTWYQDFTFKNKRNSISLGHYPEIGLKEARSRSEEIRRKVALGSDPASERRESRNCHVDASHPLSVQTIAEKWFATQATEWSPCHADKTMVRLTAHVYPSLGNRMIRTVETKEVTALIEAICAAGTVSTAKRVLSICRRVFDYGHAKGLVAVNPCLAAKAVIPRKEPIHHAAVTTPLELSEVVRRVYDLAGTFVVKCAAKLTMCTFLRSAELRGAKWSEIDLEGGVWKVPAIRVKSKPKRKKNEGAHRVPLSRQAIEILRQLKHVTGHQEYVFPGQGPKNPTISANTINNALRRAGISTCEEQTAHGFRATARTMLVEQLKFDDRLAELQLDHVVKDANGTAYNRTRMLPERAVMMQRWADYLDWLQEQPASALGPIHGVPAPAHLCSPTDPRSIIQRFLAEHIPSQWMQAEATVRSPAPSCTSPS